MKILKIQFWKGEISERDWTCVDFKINGSFKHFCLCGDFRRKLRRLQKENQVKDALKFAQVLQALQGEF